ncbi:hypothetical protein ACV8SR_01250 [Citrobacter freundii]
MTALNKQALIAKIKKQTESFDTVVLKEDEANLLLDELEAAEKRIAEHNFENRLLANADRDIKALRQRIAELEAREVNLPKDAEHDVMAPVVAYFLDAFNWDGSAVRWDGRKEYDIVADRVKYTLNMVFRRAAGIGVKGE